MKLIISLSLLFLQNGSLYSQNTGLSSSNPDAVLMRTYTKLNSLKSIKFENSRELNYSSENYHNTSKWIVYCDFQTTDTIAGFKYQVDDSTSKQVFNGAEKFDLNKKDKTISINDNPARESFSSLSALYNSIITLKNILPLLIGDKTALKTITDTTINNNLCNVVTINTGKRRIQYLGKDFDLMTTENNFIYKIIIDRDSYLPLEVVQKNDVNNDFIKTSFSRIETDTNAPSEISWYYSTYTTEYKPAADVVIPQLLSNGALSPAWTLEAYKEGKMISYSDLKGSVILLDFWIKNCGPCILSVPHLNELQDKYGGKNFRIVSINSYDSKKDVAWFYNQHKIKYPVLLHGKVTAEKYGVSGFPAFFIIDKAGKIIYSHAGYATGAQSEIEKVIKDAL